MQNIIVSIVVGAAIGYAVAAIYKGIRNLASKQSSGESVGDCGGCDGCNNDGCCGK